MVEEEMIVVEEVIVLEVTTVAIEDGGRGAGVG